jgi:hypothetical protein
MVPWLQYEGILERQRSYDATKFKNECLGLPTSLGEHIVTRAELEACCTARPMVSTRDELPREAHQRLVAGIDWGGGGTAWTVLTLGYMRSDYTFEICRFDRFAGREDPDYVLNQVTSICRRFGVRFVAADGGGNGTALNRLLAAG